MEKKAWAKLAIDAALKFFAGAISIALLLFLPAGTLDYWEAQLYLAVLFVPFICGAAYLLIKDPELVERRLRTKEKEVTQKKVIGASVLIFLAGYTIPGLDHRFNLSNIPADIVYAADAIVFLSYLFLFSVLKENSYASRVIEVEKGQKVIATGPYRFIRHPMYLGTSVMYLASPIALGSYYALIPFLFLPPLLILRINNEEEVLFRDLPGYKEYAEKTRYRLIPYVW